MNEEIKHVIAWRDQLLLFTAKNKIYKLIITQNEYAILCLVADLVAEENVNG